MAPSLQALAPRTKVGVEGLSASCRQISYFPLVPTEDCESVDQAAIVSAFKVQFVPKAFSGSVNVVLKV